MTPTIPEAAVNAAENELRSIICEWDKRREFLNVSPSPKNDFMRRQAEGLTARILSAIELFGNSEQLAPSPRAQALEEAHSDLLDHLNADIAQLERMVEQAKFAGSETGVRVKSPSVLLADLRDAAAAIRALSQPVSPAMGVERPVEGGWLPIETAPNNKAILVHYDDGNIELISADDNEYSWIAYTVKEDFCTKPTHWRPLPQAPGVAV